MINTLFLIRNEKEYQIAKRIIEKRCLNGSVVLSWSEKEPYIINTCPHLKKVMKWEEFQVKDIGLDRYWLRNYRHIEDMAREEINRFYQDEIAKSPHFIFGLVWKMGDGYYKYIDILDIFFKNYKPEIIFLDPGKSFINGLILSFMRLYGVRHERLAL